ncbi:MAG: endonuclease V [Armatimonadetes bacterium]|nr:endonuclease V [Armatimonadota bacterium]
MEWPDDVLTLEEAARLQKDLRKQVVLEDRLPNTLHAVAGLDISHSRFSSRVFAIAVLLDYPSMQVLEEAWTEGEAQFPYISGFLAFRESPFVREALNKLSRRPDLLFVDGQGIAHPRGCGIASQVCVLEDLPGIGCAKSVLYGKHGEVGPEAGDRSPLRGKWDDEIRTLGYAVRTKPRAKPMILSPGHRVSPETSVRLVLDCTRGYRLPEPTRQAHEAANRIRREQESQTAGQMSLGLE